MAVEAVFAGLPVADLEPALAWYERLLGGPPDMRPHEGEAVWQLADTALIYVVADPDRAGNGLLTVIVDDLDALLADCELQPDGIETLTAARKAVFSDPDGNSIAFAELG
jgi:catechol 2,3-dioxygenase-like lactoylglutathione lyase family enzyme